MESSISDRSRNTIEDARNNAVSLPVGSTMKRGVYILCNDHLISMAIAFLNAFRFHNPELALCLIPYRDDDVDELTSLSKTYDFSIFSDQAALDTCDEIAALISPGDHRFRKLAAWEGIFDEFIYIDIDNLVLEDISGLFSLLETYRFVLCDTYMEGNVAWCWKESIFASGKLSEDQIRFSANTSFIVSAREVIRLADVVDREQEISEMIRHMQLACGEQPLLNYLIVTSGLPASSISELASRNGGPDVGHSFWAGSKPGPDHRAKVLPGGKLQLADASSRATFIHWSGVWQARRLDHYVHRILQLVGIQRNRKAIRLWFPFKRLWLYYRYLHRQV